MGRPGYFIKELPIVPGVVAMVYQAIGRVDERAGRLAGVVSWMAGLPVVLALLWRPAGMRIAVLAGLWFVLAPLGIAYSRAFMNDPGAVTVSLLALWSLTKWCEQATPAKACFAGALTGLALLLKPHVAFWLGPAALALLARSPAHSITSRATQRRDLAWLILATSLGILGAGAWYVHAASVHQAFPVQGAMVAEGWVDLRLLLQPALYVEILRQAWEMVFTPMGALLAAFGVLSAPGAWSQVERALLAWGGGVLLQCLVFSTRMFDVPARGSEYYQLAMVPVAGVLIARGLCEVARRAARIGRVAEVAAYGLGAILLAAFAIPASQRAMQPPQLYANLLEDCAEVRRLTRPGDELVVLADRGGVVLYYCDRRGTVFQLAPKEQREQGPAAEASLSERARAFSKARYVLIPFPELLPPESGFLAQLEHSWRRVPNSTGRFLLYERPEEIS